MNLVGFYYKNVTSLSRKHNVILFIIPACIETADIIQSLVFTQRPTPRPFHSSLEREEHNSLIEVTVFFCEDDKSKTGLLIHHTASCRVPLHFLCCVIFNYFFKDLPISMLHDTWKNVNVELYVCYKASKTLINYDCMSFTLNVP